MKLILALCLLPLAGCLRGLGGCSFNESSDVTAPAAAACVTIAATDGSGADDPDAPGDAGCVVPMLYGVNGCAETLRFSAAPLVVPPGERFALEVLEAPVESGGRDVYTVPATIGDTAVAFGFSTNRL
jgi:hypothetical protein